MGSIIFTKQPACYYCNRKLSSKNKAFSITTYYFSTLYTNIPRNKLKNVIREAISLSFNDDEKQFIDVTKIGATMIYHDKNKFKTTLDKGSLKHFFNFANL